MNIVYFFKGLVVGIVMAAPIGPISILCIRRSLTGGHKAGIATALGVAIADGFYALIAALGLTALSTFLMDQKMIMYSCGGLFLTFLGIKAFNAEPVSINQPLNSPGFLFTMLQSTLLTLTNPTTILTFLAAFATMGLGDVHHTFIEAAIICLGVFCGSGLWFISLSTLAAHFRSRIKPPLLKHINQLSGLFFIACGLFLLGAALEQLIVRFVSAT